MTAAFRLIMTGIREKTNERIKPDSQVCQANEIA